MESYPPFESLSPPRRATTFGPDLATDAQKFG